MPRRYFPMQLATLVLISILSPLLQPTNTAAISASDWKAGNIIDDGPFENDSAMSVSQIQNWLNIRLKNCDPNGTQTSELSGGTDYNGDGKVTRAEYGKTYGNPAPFTCLNNYYEVPKTSPGSGTPASNYGKSTIPSGAKSAAQLIYDAGKAYNISPKVLLVKLGTESAGPLTSDTWPFKSQYTYAMGAHCPDSGPGGSANCDTDYAGFSLQMREAAKLLRWYLDSMTESWWTYKKPFAANYILWNVQETNCGGSNVYIQNKATAALYTYTPYQPNSASLNAYPGTGNSCSSYGNRNFWYVYNNWFGSGHLPQVFRTSSSTKTYLLSGSSYFYIPNPDMLAAYGYTTKDVSVVQSADVDALTYAGVLKRTARFGGNEIYLIDRGKKFHFSSQAMLNTYGYTVGDESSLDANLSYTLLSGGTVSTIINQVDNYTKYFVEAGKKRHISNPTVYSSQGSPVYSSITPTSLSRAYVNSLTDGAPVLEDFIFTKDSNGSVSGFWDGSTIQQINKSVFTDLNPSTYTSGGISLLPKSSTALSELIKTDESNFYILDSGTVYRLSASQLANAGFTSTDFTLVDSSIVTALASMVKEFKPVIRINGSNAIYLIDDGDRRHVTSRRALDDYGFTVNDAINVNTRTANHFPYSSDYVIGTGTLVRIDGGGRVYLINTKSTKVYISSPEMLQAYGYSYTRINNFAAKSLSGYPTAGTLTNFVRTTENPSEVWLIDRFHVRRFVSPSLNTSTGYGIDSTSLLTIDHNLLLTYNKRHDMTQVIQAVKDDRVYLIRDGQKQWVRSRDALANAGFSFSDISIVSPTTLREIPTGPDVT